MFDCVELRSLAEGSNGKLVGVSGRDLLRLIDEYEALRSTMNAAPVAIMDTRDVLGICAPRAEDFKALYALQGHRVALIDLGLLVKERKSRVVSRISTTAAGTKTVTTLKGATVTQHRLRG